MNQIVGPVEVEAVAHGGHCIARLDGRVLFVRHALPGETVEVKITDDSRDKFWLADAVIVNNPSPERVEPACSVSGADGCGGCDFQHTTPEFGRELKRRVVAEQLQRLAGIVWEGTVEDVGSPYGWRTRMRYICDGSGAPALRKHHSNEPIAVPKQGCLIAAPAAQPEKGLAEQLCVAAASGRQIVRPDMRSPDVTEEAAGRFWKVPADGFWQVHPAAAETLVNAVMEGLQPQRGEKAWDLFCGVGLFAGALADHGCQVDGVEGSRAAIKRAEKNVPTARFVAGDVARTISRWKTSPDLIVLDPPRSGAKQKLMADVCSRGARAIAYVACDPAALARDLKVALTAGYELVQVRAFDLFPNTHHVECVALLSKK
ncbi:MAG: class I SAM-dependent RNA methyltransferase [Propionibacteriaceae bacterium]